MEKKTISAGIIGAGGFIGQEHLERLIHEIGMEIVCEKDTIRLPLPAEPIVRSRLKVDNEIMDNWAERFLKAYNNELQHWINHLRGIEPTTGPGNKDGFAACCIADAMIASQTSEAEIWYDRRRAWQTRSPRVRTVLILSPS